jgi:hypothetical protein
LLADVSESTVVCGHTHVQFDRMADAVRVVNAGSVGFPYEAEPGAYWVLIGADVEFRRGENDLGAALASITATGYPRAYDVVPYLDPDPERPDRMSALIESAV